MRLCIFEDSKAVQLLPLVYTRPTYDLRCGIFTLREKIQRVYPDLPLTLFARTYLTDTLKQQNPTAAVNILPDEDCLFINGRVLADDTLAKKLPSSPGHEMLYLAKDEIVGAFVTAKKVRSLKFLEDGALDVESLKGLPTKDVEVQVIQYPWELVNKNGEQIVEDAKLLASEFKSPAQHGAKIHEGAYLLHPENILVGEGSVIMPTAVIDAEEGPVVIGKNVKIFPNVTIIGPAFIGDGSVLKIGAKIYENTSIGEVCKVGGEIDASIVHSYSNKQHEGFLGHSYIGSWVNLGALTTNSDLKNNYGNVKVVINGKSIDTGSMFVGLTVGDHSKSGIGTLFNTGTVVGVSCNIYGTGLPPKEIPSFAWGGAEGFQTYKVEKAIEVARRVMARRKIIMTQVDEDLLRTIFALTEKDRTRAGVLQ